MEHLCYCSLRTFIDKRPPWFEFCHGKCFLKLLAHWHTLKPQGAPWKTIPFNKWVRTTKDLLWNDHQRWPFLTLEKNEVGGDYLNVWNVVWNVFNYIKKLVGWLLLMPFCPIYFMLFVMKILDFCIAKYRCVYFIC